MKLTDIALPAAASEGKWFEYVQAWDGKPVAGVRVKLASTDLDEYRHELQRPAIEFASKAIAGGRRAGAMPGPEAQDEATVQAIAKFILLDWEGITGENDQAIPCTQQNKLQFLRVRRFRESVLALADQLAAFQETETGN